jgi:pilus assembly protein CpaC
MEDHQARLCRWSKRGGIGIAFFLGFWIVAAIAQTQQSSPTITVTVNKSLIFTLPQKARRVSVTQPEVADVTVVAPNQLLINGKSVGVTSLVIWPQSGDITNYDLVVSPDVEALRRQLKTMYANEKVEISTSGPSIVLKGEVSNEVVYDKVLEIAQTYLPPAPSGAVAPPSTAQSVTVTTPPVTLPPSGTAFAGGGQLAFNEEGAFDDVNRWGNRKRIPGIIDFLVIKEFRQIELDVIVAEISLSKARQLGLNFNFTSVLNGAGSTFSGTSAAGSQGSAGPINIGNASSILSLVTHNYNISALFRLIQNRDISEVLAQPKLVIKNGRAGGFLAGGEFPLPVQSSLGTPSTIEFKPFGVRLDFLPTITLSDSIDLRVFPEVSERDATNSVNGIPSLTVRRAVSRVEMKEGETLVLSGLVSRNTTNNLTKFPLLGDIPILGGLFRSTDFKTDEKELVIVITPKIVRPMKPGERPQIPSLEKYDSPDMRQIPLPGSAAPEASTRRSAPGGPTIP